MQVFQNKAFIFLQDLLFEFYTIFIGEIRFSSSQANIISFMFFFRMQNFW